MNSVSRRMFVTLYHFWNVFRCFVKIRYFLKIEPFDLAPSAEHSAWFVLNSLSFPIKNSSCPQPPLNAPHSCSPLHRRPLFAPSTGTRAVNHTSHTSRARASICFIDYLRLASMFYSSLVAYVQLRSWFDQG